MTPKEALKPIKEIVRLFTKKAEIENFDDEFNLIEQALNDLERLKKVEELLGLYQKREKYRVTVDGFLQSWELTKQIKALEEEMK